MMDTRPMDRPIVRLAQLAARAAIWRACVWRSSVALRVRFVEPLENMAVTSARFTMAWSRPGAGTPEAIEALKTARAPSSSMAKGRFVLFLTATPEIDTEAEAPRASHTSA
jgi:hypothetical protein